MTRRAVNGSRRSRQKRRAARAGEGRACINHKKYKLSRIAAPGGNAPGVVRGNVVSVKGIQKNYFQVQRGFNNAATEFSEIQRMPETDLKSLDLFALGNSDMERMDRIDLEMDLGDLEMKDQITDSFDDLIQAQRYRTGNLFDLTKARLLLKAGGQLRLVNTYPGPYDAIYLRNLDILLTKAGFTDLQTRAVDGVLLVSATRRPVITKQYRFNMTFRELIKPADIMRTHEFAKEIFYYKDNNYDIELSRQFDLNSDVFAVFDGSDELVSLGRVHARVPGYYPPFMYAEITDTGEHVRIPPRFERLLEVMSVYREGKFGVIAFKRLIEDLFQYGYEVAHYDSVWTTYDASDQYTGTYYKNRFLFEEFGVRLSYRDFGGEWNLIYSDQVKENCENRESLFR